MTSSESSPYSRLRKYWSRFWRIGTGLVLIALGALMGLVPGVPGIFLAIAGLALMAPEVPIADRAMVGLKAKTESARKRVKRTRSY